MCEKIQFQSRLCIVTITYEPLNNSTNFSGNILDFRLFPRKVLNQYVFTIETKCVEKEGEFVFNLIISLPPCPVCVFCA